MKGIFSLICVIFVVVSGYSNGRSDVNIGTDFEFISLTNSNELENGDELACWLFTFTCHECGETRTAQWCNEGLHGDFGNYFVNLCKQLCPREEEEAPE